jgi:hypothetical protein
MGLLTVFLTIILGFYSCVPLFLNSGGQKAVCNFQVIPKPLAISCTTSATKGGPLPDPVDTGIPNQGMISFNRHLAISWAFLVIVWKASTHPEMVETNTNRYCTLELVAFQ